MNGMLATVLVFVAVGGLVFAAGSALGRISPGRKIDEFLHEYFFVELRSGFALREALQIVIPIAGAILVFVLFLTKNFLLAAALTPLSLLGPIQVYAAQRKARRAAFEMNLPAALQQLANYASGGASLHNAVAAAAKTAPWPLNEEFDLIAQRAEAVGIAEALAIARQRLKSENFDLAVAVIRVGEGPGGDTVAALRSLADTFIELERLRNKIHSATSQTRRAMQIMSAIPVGIVPLALIFFKKEYVEPVLHNTLGIFLVVLSVLVWGMAILLMKSLSRVDV